MPAITVRLSRAQTLRALGVAPLWLRSRSHAAPDAVAGMPSRVHAPQPVAAVPAVMDAAATAGRCIALLPLREEIAQPALAALYAKIGEAIAARLGLQCVRVADAERDVAVRVLVFGAAVVPETIEPSRILRADALSVLHADRARKAALWDLLQNLARGAERG